jgi:fermentation-respiration switch protein FrsA (DUF1100 family)
VAAGVGAVVVVLDGSPLWAAARLTAVAVVCGLLAALFRADPRPGVRFMVGVAVGIPVAAAGLALMLSYRHVGLCPRLVAGALLAAGGVALVAHGARRWLEAAAWPGRILGVLGLLIACYVIGSATAMAVFATNVGRPGLGSATPAAYGLPYEDVTFRSSDGVGLSGWYLRSTNRAAIAVLHGASSTRTAALDQAAVLARAGYGVLLFDARGVGRSHGRAMNFGWHGEADLAGAVDFLRARPDVDPQRIGALGESMGGEEAIGALGVDTRLAAVVAEGATNRVASDWQWLSDAYGVRGSLQRAVQWLTYSLTDLLTEAPRPRSLRTSVTAAAPRPVLLIAAGQIGDEARADRYIERASPGTVTVWVVPGADHTGGLATAPTEWRQRVLSFFGEHLAPR